MKKYGLIFLFLLVAVVVFGQQKAKSKVNLISSAFSERLTGPDGKSIIKVHNGVFKQDYSILRSDSALFYPDLNMVDAFGHVVINQGDTLHIYSDKLNYNGNTKTAILTDHVIMVDKDATLTTNLLTYNTATRIATYTGGGKLVNKDNTLVSKNGYYFASTRDEYFRYDVVCTTPDAIIKTDTLRYNSGSRIAYFYGPTNIYGRKDKDVLYTENGYYNTINEQAVFGKKNLYTQGTKTLKGDSLFYDRLKGYGRAVKHVTFNDSEQKTTIKGDLGEYYKPADSMVMTQHPYMIFVTEDTTAKKPGDKLATDSLLKNTKIPDKDTIVNKVNKFGPVKNTHPIQRLTLQGITDSVTKRLPPKIKVNPPDKKLIKSTVDSVTKKIPPNIKINPADKKLAKSVLDSISKKLAPQANGKAAAQKQAITKLAEDIKDTSKTRKNIRYDSLYFAADTLKTQVLTFKNYKLSLERHYQAMHRDTSIKVRVPVKSVVYTKKNLPKFLEIDPPKYFAKVPRYLHPEFFGRPDPPKSKAPPKVVKVAVKPTPKKSPADSIKDKRKADSLALRALKPLSDTSRIRVVYGYHNAKLFKSDLQAKADSMAFSSSDSTIRCYVNPIVWTQGSQLSGDTIHLQMKNKKLDNMDMFPAAFIVNIERNDSVHFNQAGGKKMHGTFKNNKLNTMLITGNAETIYFNRDTVKHTITEMSRTVSGRINATFKNGAIHNFDLVEKSESKANPIAKVKEEDKLLKAFIWKPKERPASKEAVLAGTPQKLVVKGASGKTGPASKKPDAASKKPGDVKLSGDTTAKPPVLKMSRDSITKDTVKRMKPLIKMGKDSVVKDSTTVKKAVVKKP